MNTKDNKYRRSKRNIIIALILLLLTNTFMGITLMTMSKNALRKQIEQRMLDVANTAAYQLNGDDLKGLTADDIGSEKYERAMKTLLSFQINIQLDYIYAIRDEGNDLFTFTIDPDPEDPEEFGAPIETTDALRKAAKGTPGVDKTAITDEWGRFYSAYSPVYDSNGEITGIVGVDFDADWYDGELNNHKIVVIALSMFAVTMCIVIAFILHAFRVEGEKNEYRKKLEETLERELVQEQELGSARYLAYTDQLTGVKSKHAYREAIEKLENELADGKVKAFGVIVFDLNGLKMINDTRGHEAGDSYIKAGCDLICKKFCHSPVFRIGGDEFVVLLEGSDYLIREGLLADFDSIIEENQVNGEVVVSTGMDIFVPGEDEGYSDVFERADKKMYERKRQLKSMK